MVEDIHSISSSVPWQPTHQCDAEHYIETSASAPRIRRELTRGPTHMEQIAPHSRDTSTDATGARHGSDHTNTRRPCRRSKSQVRLIQLGHSESAFLLMHTEDPNIWCSCICEQCTMWQPMPILHSTPGASKQPTEAAYSRPAANSKCATGLAARSRVPAHLHVSRSHTCSSC